jgi:hypothetical protein
LDGGYKRKPLEMDVYFFHQEEENAVFSRKGSTYCQWTAWHASRFEKWETKNSAPFGDRGG